MSWAAEPDAVSALREALGRCEVVSSIVLGGSRARGLATELSDWDIYLEGDPEGMLEEIPRLVAPFGPLAAFWEPLAEEAGYMVVMDGPTKVDIFPLGASRQIQPPWRVSGDSLASIDAHFWDWTLWLGGKALRGQQQLVADELAKCTGSYWRPSASFPPPRAWTRRSPRTARHGHKRWTHSGLSFIRS